jgi:hypothetical protein
LDVCSINPIDSLSVLLLGSYLMWLLTNLGFFSIVQKSDDKSAGSLTIRSRVKSDLENLQLLDIKRLGVVRCSSNGPVAEQIGRLVSKDPDRQERP